MSKTENATDSRRGATIVEFTLTFMLFLLVVVTLLELRRGI